MVGPNLDSVSAYQEVPQHVIQKTHEGVVSIKSQILYAAYRTPGTRSGTGFLVDRKRGVIVTNAHVVAFPSIGSYEVTFHNGNQVKARLLYCDPCQDFALLKVDPAVLTPDIQQLPLCPQGAIQGGSVFILGQNGGQSASFQTGYISSLHDMSGVFPTQSIRISLNTRGGGSGSPLCDGKGRVIGLIHSSDMDSFGFALPIEFVKDALIELERAFLPKRKATGAMLAYRSVDELTKLSKLPPGFAKRYNASYTKALGHILVVESVLEGSPAEGVLLPGDIVFAVKGQEIGPSFYQLEKLLNQSSESTVNFTVIRNGEFVNTQVNLYNLHKNTIYRILLFGGGVFYEADETARRLLGAKKGEVLLTHVRQGSSFGNVFPPIPGGTSMYFVHLEGIEGHSLRNMSHLLEMVPDLLSKDAFSITYRNYAFSLLMGDTAFFSQAPHWTWVEMNHLDSMPQLFTWDPKRMIWNQEVLKPKTLSQAETKVSTGE